MIFVSFAVFLTFVWLSIAISYRRILLVTTESQATMAFETIFPAQYKKIHLNGWTKTKKRFCIRKPDVLQTISACLVDNQKMNVPLTHVLYYSPSWDHNTFPFSKVTAGKLETEPKEVCMGKVLRSLVLYDSRVGLSLRAFYCWCSSRNDNKMRESTKMAIRIWKKGRTE